MTETHKLNRLVICLLYAACGLMRRVKRPRTACADRFRRAAPLRLSTERRGCVSDSFFESDRMASEASYTTKSSCRKEPLRLSTISSGASVIGELANSVV